MSLVLTWEDVQVIRQRVLKESTLREFGVKGMKWGVHTGKEGMTGRARSHGDIPASIRSRNWSAVKASDLANPSVFSSTHPAVSHLLDQLMEGSVGLQLPNATYGRLVSALQNYAANNTNLSTVEREARKSDPLELAVEAYLGSTNAPKSIKMFLNGAERALARAGGEDRWASAFGGGRASGLRDEAKKELEELRMTPKERRQKEREDEDRAAGGGREFVKFYGEHLKPLGFKKGGDYEGALIKRLPGGKSLQVWPSRGPGRVNYELGKGGLSLARDASFDKFLKMVPRL